MRYLPQMVYSNFTGVFAVNPRKTIVLLFVLSAVVLSCGQKNPTRFDEGSVFVDSEPTGATIAIDGNSSELMTPDTVTGVTAGTHRVTVSLEGYQSDPEEEVVTVMAGETTSASFALSEAKYGSIYVDSDPQGAAIYLDGDSTGQVTPDTLALVLTGQRTVGVLLSGYESDSQEIDVSPDETATAFFTLAEVAFSKTVLVEEFTNTSCIPCADASPILDGLVSQFGRDNVVAVKYHTGFPGANDPFYLHNRSDSDARQMYYFVTGIPHLRVDGSTSPSLDSLQVRMDIQSRLAVTPPLILDASYEILGSEYTVRAQVISGSVAIPADLVIHFALVESGFHIDPPPGINGETDFEHVMRAMFPSGNGESFTISDNDTLEFIRQFTIDPTWVESNIETVVFVQSQSSLEVLQACSDHK